MGHFTLDVSLGQILTVFSIIGVGFTIIRRFDRILWEHDMMWQDYAKTHDIPPRIKKKS